MKKFLSILLAILCLLSLPACRKKSDKPCSICGGEKAYLYEIDHVDGEVLEEKITVCYCESCYDKYLVETFGKGLYAKAREEDSHFKDVVGQGGYIEELK